MLSRTAHEKAPRMLFWEQDKEIKPWVGKAERKKGMLLLLRELDPLGPGQQQWPCKLLRGAAGNWRDFCIG